MIIQSVWKIQADPKHAGKHPLHDNRFITTANFDFDDFNENEEIVCKLTDSPNQKIYANWISATPELIRACREALLFIQNAFIDYDSSTEIRSILYKALTKAKLK